MRFGGDGPETHRTRAEAFDNFRRWLHVLDRNGTAVDILVEIEQPAKRASHAFFMVHSVRKPPIGGLVVGARGDLDVGDRLGVPRVPLSLGAPMKFARVGE